MLSLAFNIFLCVASFKELKSKLDTQKVQIGIFIKNSFARDIKSDKGAAVQIIFDDRQTNSVRFFMVLTRAIFLKGM